MTHHYRLLPVMVAAILGMGAAAGVLAWVAWCWTERGW